jgi:hypothetical protein
MYSLVRAYAVRASVKMCVCDRFKITCPVISRVCWVQCISWKLLFMKVSHSKLPQYKYVFTTTKPSNRRVVDVLIIMEKHWAYRIRNTL